MRAIVLALLLSILVVPLPARGADETLGGIERDLVALLRELDSVKVELDRLGEIAAMPKSTGIRIEIARGGDVPAPAAGRVEVDGNTEDDREWTRTERDGFADGSRSLVVTVPVSPGSYAARIELTHPAWQGKATADFRVAVRPGETASRRFRMLPAPGKPAPALAPDAGR